MAPAAGWVWIGWLAWESWPLAGAPAEIWKPSRPAGFWLGAPAVHIENPTDSRLAGQLAGWLAGRLVDWLAGFGWFWLVLAGFGWLQSN